MGVEQSGCRTGLGMPKVTRAGPLFLLPGLQKVVPTTLHAAAHPLSDFRDIIGTVGWCSLYPKLPCLSGCSLVLLPGWPRPPGTSDRWEGVGVGQAAPRAARCHLGDSDLPPPALLC